MRKIGKKFSKFSAFFLACLMLLGQIPTTFAEDKSKEELFETSVLDEYIENTEETETEIKVEEETNVETETVAETESAKVNKEETEAKPVVKSRSRRAVESNIDWLVRMINEYTGSETQVIDLKEGDYEFTKTMVVCQND